MAQVAEREAQWEHGLINAYDDHEFDFTPLPEPKPSPTRRPLRCATHPHAGEAVTAEDKNTTTASHANAHRTSVDASACTPLPDHRNVNTAWWQELWRRHAHIITPLRQRGLECDIEFGLSAYIVRVSLPDDSYLIIGPPQEPSCDRPPGDPQGWIVTRQHPDDQALFEVMYDSAPSADPGAPARPEARHAGNATPLIEAIDQRLIQLGLLPAPYSSTARALLSTPTPTLRAPKTPGRLRQR